MPDVTDLPRVTSIVPVKLSSDKMKISSESGKLSPMPFQINKVAVLGAGTMGSRIAAHLANAGVVSYLLDIVPSGAPSGKAGEPNPERNKIVQAGLEGAQKSKPAAFFGTCLARLIQTANFVYDLKVVADADWTIGAAVGA